MHQLYVLNSCPPVSVEIQIKQIIGASFILQRTSNRLLKEITWALYAKTESLTAEQETLVLIILGPYL